MRRDDVVVVGAGIAGLTAALALAERGFAVEILERSDELREIGAGLQLSPNALRVLHRLGVLDELRPHAVEADAVGLGDLSSGRLLARVPVRSGDGTPYLSVLRTDLQRVLLGAAERVSAIRLRLGTHVAGIRAIDDGCELTVTGDASAPVRASAVVAADGVRSAVAAALGHEAARPAAHVAWRIMLPADGRSLAGITAWLAPQCHVVAYPVDAGKRLNIVVVAPENVRDPQRLLDSRDPFIESVRAEMPAATPWPLTEADRPRRPSDPPGVVMIGDAAHAMLPFAAQGAALAIEDGYVAAACLAGAPGAATAWREFEALRRPRWDKVRQRVAFHQRVYHLPAPLAFGRNLALRLRSPDALARGLAWLYDWQPPAVR